ncbi:MAG: TlpA family protein disulfide reductase [Terracidiphilus sp.]
MRFPRFLVWLFLAPFALLVACNRGSRPSQTGVTAPDFTLSDGTTTIHLADYRGKVVLLNFWATWCMPCVEEMPSLLALHHEQPNLVILAVSVDDDPGAYARFIVRHHIDFTTVRDAGESVPKLYHTDMWPETYVIDRKGIIRRKFVGSQEWTSPEIANYLKGL